MDVWFPNLYDHVLSRFSCVQLCATLCTIACQAPLSTGVSRKEHWSGLPGPSPGNLPNPGTESTSLKSPALADVFFTTSSTWEDFLTMEPFFSEISHFPRVLRKSLAKYGMNSKFLYLASQSMAKPQSVFPALSCTASKYLTQTELVTLLATHLFLFSMLSYFILEYSWLTMLCFRCTAKLFSYKYICIYYFFKLFSDLGCCIISSRIPCAIKQVPVGYPF